MMTIAAICVQTILTPTFLFMTSEEIIEEELGNLKRKGYQCKFILHNDSLYCPERDMNFRSHELLINEEYRFEDKNDPSRNTILFTIESSEYQLRGFLEITPFSSAETIFNEQGKF
jgi:hypothetical protein